MSEPVTARLDAISARADAATDGPWEIFRYANGGGRIHISGDDGRPRDLIADMDGDPDSIATVYNEADRELLFAARSDVPALVAAVRAVLNLCDKNRGRCSLCNEGDRHYDYGGVMRVDEVRAAVAAALDGQTPKDDA